MRSIKLQDPAGTAPERQNFGAEERYVLIMNHVRRAALDDLLNPLAPEVRTTGLMRKDRRENPNATAQAMHRKVGTTLDRLLRWCGMQCKIRIKAMDDLDQMTALGQRVRQAGSEDRIATEAIGRIENRDEKKFKRSRYQTKRASILSSIRVAGATTAPKG